MSTVPEASNGRRWDGKGYTAEAETGLELWMLGGWRRSCRLSQKCGVLSFTL